MGGEDRLGGTAPPPARPGAAASIGTAGPAVTCEVVAGLLRQEGLLLLGRRSVRRQWYPGVWDLPGGHVEPGEVRVAVLARELHEEFDIVVAAPDRSADASLSADDDLRLDVWLVDEWTGTPRNAQPEEHVRWAGSGSTSSRAPSSPIRTTCSRSLSSSSADLSSPPSMRGAIRPVS